jgi:hypothetical protein
MVTIPTEPEETQLDLTPETEETGTTEADEAEESDENVDYKAVAKRLEAQVGKLENDLRSKDGQRRRDTERDADISGFRDELGAIRKVLSLYMEGMNRGDTEEVQSQISQVNQELAQGQARRVYDSRYEKEQSRLLSTVQDEGGNLLINEDDATRLQTEWQNAWQKAATGDFEDVYNIQIEAHRMVSQEERRRVDTQQKQLREEAKNAGKKALEKAGIADLDTGAAIAGGNEELRGTALIERGLRRKSL